MIIDWQSLVETAPVGFLVTDGKGKILFSNSVISELMELAAPEFGSSTLALTSLVSTLWSRRAEGVWLMRTEPLKSTERKGLRVTCTKGGNGSRYLFLVIPEKIESKPEWLQGSLIYGPVRLDSKTFTAYWGRVQLQLSPIEFKLLLTFCEQPDMVWSQEKLLRKIWNQTSVETRKVDVFVGRINRKIAIAGGPKKLLQNRRGLGYVIILDQ